MKRFLLVFVLLSHAVWAQIPTGYYDTATGTGYTLKTQLRNIISSGYIDLGYSGLWTTYSTSDRDYYYENDATILDIYSENPTGSDPYNFTYGAPYQDTGTGGTNEGEFYNREHIIPQSVFKEFSPMRNDAHFIPPTDKKVNSVRSNYPHGVVSTATYTSLNGSKLGSASNSGYAVGYTGTVFEPINEFKGDIARMYFYFATRYEDVITTWGISYAMFNNTTNQVFTTPFISILLNWHVQDPVSQSEIGRNNAIYTRQNNRNPFIDNPNYANQIWGHLVTLSINEYLNNQFTVYPNPTKNQTVFVSVDNSIQVKNMEVMQLTGKLIKSVKNPIIENNLFKISDLPIGFYILKIETDQGTAHKKIIVN